MNGNDLQAGQLIKDGQHVFLVTARELHYVDNLEIYNPDSFYDYWHSFYNRGILGIQTRLCINEICWTRCKRIA